ncbi:hypothetical protein F4782DRAFT_550389 [Xylaria castorea]|nr:hypothetical protein F4782DRAFT_550389 [Xylaria castorea]
MTAQTDQTSLPCGNAIEGYAAQVFDAADGVKDCKALDSCTICDSEAKMRCSICGTWYCNRECRDKDWNHHKALCKAFKDEFSSNKAPLNNVRAILFPMDANKPSWVWINLKTFDISIIRALGITTPRPLKKAVNKLAMVDINKSLHHRKIGHGIRQFTAPSARLERPEGHNINKSIFALAEAGSLKTYFGSALFLGFRTDQTRSITKVYYEDASPRDLRMIIEWYYTRPENPFISKSHRLPIKSYCDSEEETFFWPAVKINCKGDVDRLSTLSGEGVDPIQSVWVLSKDVFEKRTTCDLAAIAGLPWIVQPCCSGTFDPIADLGNENDLFYNEGGKVFAPQTKSRFQRWHLDNSEGWVLPAHLPSKYCGTLLVTRNDGCIIYAPHVIAFFEFVASRLNNVKAHVVYETEEEGIGRALIDESDVKRVITREGFEPFWYECLNKRVGKTASLYPSPYNDTNVAESDTVDEVKEARGRLERSIGRFFTSSI